MLDKLWEQIKGAFTTSGGDADWIKILGTLGGLGSSGAFGSGIQSLLGGGSSQRPVGYQGGIPKYTYNREQIAYDDEGRRPGSGGRRYFTDGIYQLVPTASNTGTTTTNTGGTYIPTPSDTGGSDTTTNTAQAQQAGATWQNMLDAYNSGDNVAAREYYNQYYDMTGTKNAPTGYDALPTIDDVENSKNMAAGGLASVAPKGYYLGGVTDGMADKVPASIGGQQPARLSDGEFVVPADVVSHLGNGNSNAGAKELYDMMDRIRKARTGRVEQGKQVAPRKYMPN